MAQTKGHYTHFGSPKLPSCLEPVDSIWEWIILAYIVKNKKPNLKIKEWKHRNRSSDIRGNDQWKTMNKLVTSLSWMEFGFYLARNTFRCWFRWVRRAPIKVIQWWLLIPLASLIFRESDKMLPVLPKICYLRALLVTFICCS